MCICLFVRKFATADTMCSRFTEIFDIDKSQHIPKLPSPTFCNSNDSFISSDTVIQDTISLPDLYIPAAAKNKLFIHQTQSCSSLFLTGERAKPTSKKAFKSFKRFLSAMGNNRRFENSSI